MADTKTRSIQRKAAPKTTARKAATRKTPARRSAAARKPDHRVRNRSIAALGVVGAVAAGAAWAVSFGLIDKLFGARNAEHPAPDLATGKDVHAGRAPDAFRPDPTAAVPAGERESLRPATGSAPSLMTDRGAMNSQTGPALADA